MLGTRDNGGFSDDMLTDDNGKFRRVKVEDGLATFFAGRQFRMYVELDIPAAGHLWVRHTIGSNFILHDQRIVLESGAVRWAAVAGTSSSPGPWSPATMRRRNQMTNQPQPMFASASVIETATAAAAAVGGFEVDVMRVNTGGGNANASVAQNAGLRGLAAGVYHAHLFNPSNQPAVGVYDWWWEEVP
jgi:hypothetical protein